MVKEFLKKSHLKKLVRSFTLLLMGIIVQFSLAYSSSSKAYFFNYPLSSPPSPSVHFGESWDGHIGHLGEDYPESIGTPVYAVAKGSVFITKENTDGWGYAIIIEHEMPDGTKIYSQYAHLNGSPLASSGIVLRGEKIGEVGQTGEATGYHLHFEIKTAPNFGIGYTDEEFSGDQHEYGGYIYYKPSAFINSRCIIPLSGDWNADSEDEKGFYNTNTSQFSLGNGQPIGFGEIGDIPIIGDWNGDGFDEIGLYRPKKDHTLNESTFYLDLNNDGGRADKTIQFGPYSEDIPIAGDWDGDGDDDIGGYYPANSTFYLYLIDLDTSNANSYMDVPFGQLSDYPVIGDWDGDGDDDIGIFRVGDPNENTNNFYFDLNLTGYQAEYNVTDFGSNGYGNVGDFPVTGDWDGDGDDNIGVYRPSDPGAPYEKFYSDINIPNISIQHTVSVPNIPNGPSDGYTSISYNYTAGGSSCSQGDSVEYRFDWGDGTYSTWSASASASHSWSDANTFTLKSQARCSIDTSIVSEWSPGMTITISTYIQEEQTFTGYLDQDNTSKTHSITSQKDGELKFNVVYDSTLRISSIGIYDTNNAFLFGTGSPSSGVDYGPYGLKAGTYYIKIPRWSGYGGYTLTTTYDVQVIANDTEPNEQFSDANEAPLNGSAPGHLGYIGGGDATIDNVDIYTTTLDSDGEFEFNITYDSTLRISSIGIYDTNNAFLFGTGSPSSGVDYGPYGLKAGTYYIKIPRWSGYGGYALTTIYDAQVITNDIEPNEQFSDANEVPLNRSAPGHLGYKGGGDGTTDTMDIFTSTLDSDGELKFKIIYDSTLSISGYSRGIEIYDTSATLLFYVRSPSSGVDYGPDGLKAGTYYMKIFIASGYGGYTLTTTYDAQAIANDTEPNEQFSDANEAQLNESVTGHLGYKGGGDGTIDTVDIFTSTLDSDGELKFKIIYDSTLSISGYSRGIEIYDANATRLFYERSPSSGVDYGPYELKAGTYYIKILIASGYGGYTLRLFHPEIGSMQVSLTPQEVVEAGAKWQVDGGRWHDSGATVTGLSVGEHEVEYKAIAGWNAPADETVTVVEGQTTQLARTYTIIQTGNLKVTLDPEEAVNAGAKWNVDEGGWQDSGATVTGLNVGKHTVNYKSISGWIAPRSETVDITLNQTTQLTRTYTLRPNINLSLDPSIGTSGNNITLSIDISDNIHQISSFGLDFVYDNTVFELNEINQGSLTSGWSIEGNEIIAGKIKIEGITGVGTIINENSVGSLVEIKLQVKCSDYEEETEIQLKIENYTEGIAECFPHPCTTDFTFVPCPRLGDVNDDGELTPGDAQNAFEIYLGKLTPDFCQDSTSDANCSGSITPGDAQEIFKHFLGKIILPECCAESVGSSVTTSLKRFTDEKRRKPNKRMLYPLNTICRSGEIVKVPVIINDPEGIGSFGFEVNYDPELLEYIGLSESTLTNEFDYVREIKEVEGLVRVEGESRKPIKHKNYGSLAVMVFRVKEGINVGLPIVVFNLGKDLSRVETREGTFIGLDHFKSETRSLDLGEAIIMADGTLRIPVKVSSAFNMKSFGLELRYSKEKMIFTGVNRGGLTRDFAALDGNEIEPGIIRVGGYGMSEIQESEPGVLVELVFYMREAGGDVEIVKLFDDIRDFIIQKGNIKLDKQNN